jgi:hypothetical protein
MWTPRFLAAEALSSIQFTVAVGELEYDEPFTALITFDGRFPQPWSRVEVQREIVDLTYARPSDDSEAVPVALSNEGDVYVLTETVTRSKIPGAGINSPDATGRGATWAVVAQGHILYVAGSGGQVFRSAVSASVEAANWEDISPSVVHRPGYEPVAFSHAAALGPNQLILAGHIAGALTQPGNPDYDLTDDMSVDDMLAMMTREREDTSPGPDTGTLYIFKDGQLSPFDIPENIHIRDIYVDPNGRVWIAGVDGLIMRGTPEIGFERLDYGGDTTTLISLTWFRDELIAASDYGLHRFNGHILSPLRPLIDPKINNGVPTPLKVQSVGDVMFYFDYKHGVSRWDGETWDRIDIPPALLEREFNGLP